MAQKIWKESPNDEHLTGIPTFLDQASSSAEDLFFGHLETIDLHHGQYSSSAPYTILEVIGSPMSDRIKEELSTAGFNEIHFQRQRIFCITSLTRSRVTIVHRQ